MTEFNKPTQEKDWDALAEEQLASTKRAMKISSEDAAVRAAHKVMAEFNDTGRMYRVNQDREKLLNMDRNKIIEEVALHIEKLQGFGKDTVDSLAIYIREMKK
tara:strand:- start:1803 stop:2111 length:309 start_codon:yes stop_codon:yes gene_type:complete